VVIFTAQIGLAFLLQEFFQNHPGDDYGKETPEDAGIGPLKGFPFRGPTNLRKLQKEEANNGSLP
jgi:hypothetical protein